MSKFSCPITLTTKTRIKIYDLAIKDYENQIEELKNNKQKLIKNNDYNFYRKKYVLLINNKNSLKKSRNKLLEKENK